MFARTLLGSALALTAIPALATTYTLDPEHTQIHFSWNHFGFSNPGAVFGKLDGTLDYDEADPTRSKVSVTIPLDAINSNVPKLDAHMESPDFFDAARYPTATFKSTKVEKGAAANHLKVTGDLAVHGATHPVTLDVTVNKIGGHPLRNNATSAGFDASATIKRSDFGITKYVPGVSDDIALRITVEAVESKAYAESLRKAQ
ncbi:MAG TPA: YceI family protein [Rhodanobacteraceae bacterium]|nr:YceI family protein [Rhodanobacteraceae bacterium]